MPEWASGSGAAVVVDRLRAAGCVFAEDEARLLLDAADSPDALERLIARRVGGEPIEHLLGWAEFCGRRVCVVAGVFVPRRRTELLVREAAAVTAPGATVVDLCCGSGAVGAALAAAVGPIDLTSADIDPVAVRCAQRNVAEFGGRASAGDLYDALPEGLLGRVDVIVANAPYVPTDELRLMPPEARDHEPRQALDGGSDGVDVQRRLIAAAPDWLAADGRLLVETSTRQAPLTVAAFERVGLAARVATDAEIGGTVVVGARLG